MKQSHQGDVREMEGDGREGALDRVQDRPLGGLCKKHSRQKEQEQIFRAESELAFLKNKKNTPDDWNRVKTVEEGTSWGQRGKQGPLLSMDQNLDFLLCVVRSY